MGATLDTWDHDHDQNEGTEEIEDVQYSTYPFSAGLLDVPGVMTLQDADDR